MKMQNLTPFPNFRFVNSDNLGKDFCVAVVKATYQIIEGRLAIAEEQAPIIFEDRYHGEINISSLWMPSDVVSKKPRTDVILNAVARAPDGRAATTWACGLRVEGRNHVFDRKLRVFGPRQWIPRRGFSSVYRADRPSPSGWILSDPQQSEAVPIRYENAYGGTLAVQRRDADTPTYETIEFNPIGCGLIAAGASDGSIRAPQIEWFEDPGLGMEIPSCAAGFGPIPPAWLPRRPLGGTYDDHWQEVVWPNWPSDYDFAYNNSANPGLIYPAYVRGDEAIRLDGLHANILTHYFQLPGIEIFLDADATSYQLELDTVFLDVEDLDADEHRVMLTWRTTLPNNKYKYWCFRMASLEAEK